MHGKLILGILAALVLLPACARRPVATDTSQAADIPKEIAIQKLKELLVAVESVYCAEPKDTLKPSEIRSMPVSPVSLEVARAKGTSLILAYREIRLVQAASLGNKGEGACRVFTTRTRSKDQDKPHFEFLFKTVAEAQQMTELLTALRKPD